MVRLLTCKCDPCCLHRLVGHKNQEVPHAVFLPLRTSLWTLKMWWTVTENCRATLVHRHFHILIRWWKSRCFQFTVVTISITTGCQHKNKWSIQEQLGENPRSVLNVRNFSYVRTPDAFCHLHCTSTRNSLLSHIFQELKNSYTHKNGSPCISVHKAPQCRSSTAIANNTNLITKTVVSNAIISAVQHKLEIHI